MGIFKRKKDQPRPPVGPNEPVPGADDEVASA